MAAVEQARVAGDDAATDAAFQRLVKKWPYIGNVSFLYAEYLEQRQRYDQAIGILEGYIRRARRIGDEIIRDAGWERFLLIRIMLRAGYFERAERVANASFKLRHAVPEMRLQFAEIARERGDEATAMQRFADAAAVEPAHPVLIERHVRELVAAGRIDEAETELLRGLRRIERAQPLSVLYAQIAQDRGDWEEAVRRWADVREQFVFCREAYDKPAEALRALGREADAEAVLASRPRSVGANDD